MVFTEEEEDMTDINEWKEKMKYVFVDILQFKNIYLLTATLTTEQWADMFLTFLEYKDYSHIYSPIYPLIHKD